MALGCANQMLILLDLGSKGFRQLSPDLELCHRKLRHPTKVIRVKWCILAGGNLIL